MSTQKTLVLLFGGAVVVVCVRMGLARAGVDVPTGGLVGGTAALLAGVLVFFLYAGKS